MLTSQTWLTSEDTDHPVWTHWLSVCVPNKVNSNLPHNFKTFKGQKKPHTQNLIFRCFTIQLSFTLMGVVILEVNPKNPLNSIPLLKFFVSLTKLSFQVHRILCHSFISFEHNNSQIQFLDTTRTQTHTHRASPDTKPTDRFSCGSLT